MKESRKIEDIQSNTITQMKNIIKLKSRRMSESTNQERSHNGKHITKKGKNKYLIPINKENKD